MPPKKIAIFVVAYNAASTIGTVLDRIPQSIRELVDEVFVFDDASHDSTHLVAHGWKQLHGFHKLTIIRHPVNQGYGGNQKLGYKYALEKGHDIVVLLHGDGQYAPEVLPEILAPLLEGKTDAVFGSRMMTKGSARAGGMPLYKYVGNKILTKFENWATGARLSEWHSGYRAYTTNALRQIPFAFNTGDFHFDSEIIIQLLDRKLKIMEVPIPTYYGDEICYVNGLKYAGNLFKVILQYKAHKVGYRTYPKFAASDGNYELKTSPYSSHALVQDAIKPGSRVLDLGCTTEMLKGLIHKGCRVTGVNQHPVEMPEMEKFILQNLEQPLTIPVQEKYDFIILADVVEHLTTARQTLAQAKSYLTPKGQLVLSTGNIALWFMRLSLLFGNFYYGRRGILDETHVHLYTKNTLLNLVKNTGFRPVKVSGTSIPFELLFAGSAQSWWVKTLTWSYAQLVQLWPSMFAYQFVVVAEDANEPETKIEIPEMNS